MIAARQELDLRPKLDRLDAVLLRSAGVDPDRVHFTFRPLWQLNGLERAQVALQKAQATQVYATLNLWPASVTGDLVRGQLLEDGTYPTAGAVFAAGSQERSGPEWAQLEVADYSPDQPRDDQGRWTAGGGAAGPRPGSAFIHARTGFGDPPVRSVFVGGDPTTGEPPEDELERLEREEEKKERARADPSTGFTARPDGTIAPPMLPMAPGVTPNDVRRGFAGPKSMQKWQNQMLQRGWTADQIEGAIHSGERYPAENRINPGNGATRYVHPKTGRSVVIDDETGQVIQLGGDDFDH